MLCLFTASLTATIATVSSTHISTAESTSTFGAALSTTARPVATATILSPSATWPVGAAAGCCARALPGSNARAVRVQTHTWPTGTRHWARSCAPPMGLQRLRHFLDLLPVRILGPMGVPVLAIVHSRAVTGCSGTKSDRTRGLVSECRG